MSGYQDGAAHLRDELGRIDLLVRAQLECFRAELGALKASASWGLPSVAEAEVDDYLTGLCAVGLPKPLPEAAASHVTAAADAAKRIAERVAATPEPSRLTLLTERFGLDERERDVLLLCLLSEVDTRYGRLFGYLHDDATATALSQGLALRIVAPELAGTGLGRSVFAVDGTVSRRHLVVLEPLRLEPRIAGFLLGEDAVDPVLDGVVRTVGAPRGVDELVLEPQLRDRLRKLARWLSTHEDASVTLLHGPYGSGRKTVAAALCVDAGVPVLQADVRAALGSPWSDVVRLCYREARLRGSAVCWVGADPLFEPDYAEHRDLLIAAAEEFGGITVLTAEAAWDPADSLPGGRFLRVDLAAPGFPQRKELWLALLPPDGEFEAPATGRAELAALLANTFQLTAGQISDSVGSARSIARVREPSAPRLRVTDLYEGCRRQSGRRLVAFARRIEPRTELGFADLVLPAPNRRQLEELRSRITLRGRVYSELGFERRLSLGRGVVAMFTGASGTGKTMAAELLAREQGADLYKVDLSAIVSKYVGETEKNLDRVFADAEQTNAMIFFDEADALFAKRGEVKEARDRWANVEMAFLLQRVEEFRGVVVLASNLRQNIDEAFLRRLHAVVDFPAPDAAARLRIWRGMFPAGLAVPPEEELVELAAKFPLSGGSVKNVVLDAAFRALKADPVGLVVTSRALAVSVGREYQKLGLPITPGEFGRPFYDWVEQELLLDGGEPDGQ
jgi:AAA+ superfamily predicted ATPase